MNIIRKDSSKVKTQKVSDFGMTLELYVVDKNDRVDNNIEYPLLKIIADDKDELQYLQIPNGKGSVEIPISSIKKMIKVAETDVHSETWFDKNIFDKY